MCVCVCVPGCGRLCFSAVALWCLQLCVMEVVACDGSGVADAEAAGVAGERKAPVGVETASEDTQRDAACGNGPLGPCRPGATSQTAPSHLSRETQVLVLSWKAMLEIGVVLQKLYLKA